MWSSLILRNNKSISGLLLPKYYSCTSVIHVYYLLSQNNFTGLWRRWVTMRMSYFNGRSTHCVCLEAVHVSWNESYCSLNLTSVARPSSFAGPASPRHIAQTMEDLPVPTCSNTIYSKYYRVIKFSAICYLGLHTHNKLVALYKYRWIIVSFTRNIKDHQVYWP